MTTLHGHGVARYVEIPLLDMPNMPEGTHFKVEMRLNKYVKAKRKWGPKYQRVRANKPVVIWEF